MKLIQILVTYIMFFFSCLAKGQDANALNNLPCNIELGKTTIEEIKNLGRLEYGSDNPMFFNIPHFCSITLSKEGIIIELRVFSFCDSLIQPKSWSDLHLRFATDKNEGTSQSSFDSILKAIGVKKLYEQKRDGYSNYFWKSGTYYFMAKICTGKMFYGFRCGHDIEKHFQNGFYEIEISMKNDLHERKNVKKRKL